VIIGILIIIWMVRSDLPLHDNSNSNNNNKRNINLHYYCNAMEFDPYQLNGGLIVAVAHKDYIVIASDTRMIGTSGYDILQRNHISSRLWSATTSTSPTMATHSQMRNGIYTTDHNDDDNDMTAEIDKKKKYSQSKQQQNNKNDPLLQNTKQSMLLSSDGSLRIPFQHLHPKLFSSSLSSSLRRQPLSSSAPSTTATDSIESVKKRSKKSLWTTTMRRTTASTTSSSHSNHVSSSSASLQCISQWLIPCPTTTTTTTPYAVEYDDTTSSHHRSYKKHRIRSYNIRQQLPVLIGSSGCSVDCEILKRTIRSEIKIAQYYGEMSSSFFSTVSEVVTLLSQILYTRRGFPYYSFCIIAGLSIVPSSPSSSTSLNMNENNNKDDFGHCCGQVYIYDAIGSYEQVAVACTGTGRELMQPILDRRFHSTIHVERGRYHHDDKCPNGPNNDYDDSMESSTSDPILSTTATSTSTTTSSKSRMGIITPRSNVISTNITINETVAILIDSYRSVSEREIGVGDQIVLYTMERQTKKKRGDKNNNGMIQCTMYTAPLKKH
jgi:20S proteasome alpha/beta subunit